MQVVNPGDLGSLARISIPAFNLIVYHMRAVGTIAAVADGFVSAIVAEHVIYALKRRAMSRRRLHLILHVWEYGLLFTVTYFSLLYWIVGDDVHNQTPLKLIKANIVGFIGVLGTTLCVNAFVLVDRRHHINNTTPGIGTWIGVVGAATIWMASLFIYGYILHLVSLSI